MVALQILALSVRVRVLLSQQLTLIVKELQNYAQFLRTLPAINPDGGVAQLVRASDS